MLYHLFGQLRSHLNAPPHLIAPHAHEIVALIEQAVALDAERVAHEWHGYLNQHPNLPELTASSMKQLRALGVVLPERLVALELRDETPGETFWEDEALQRVHTLSLESCPLGGEGIASLLESTHLTQCAELSFQDAELDNDALTKLCQATNLAHIERLDLTHNDFDGKALASLAHTDAFPALTHLDISHKLKIDAEHSHVILSTSLAPQLIEFGVNRCGLKGLQNDFTRYASLQAVDLSSNYLNDIDLSQFIEHPHSRGLRHLDLSQNSIGDQGLLMVLNQCARVHTLHMAKTRLSALAAEHLVHSTHAHDLCSLDLSRSRLHTASALTLAEGRFPSLHSLYMEESRLEFAGLLALLSSDAFPALRLCRLGRNAKVRPFADATRAGLLTQAPPRSVLWHERARRQREVFMEPATLDVQANGLSGEQLRELAKAVKAHAFTHLDVSDNQLEDTGVISLVEILGHKLTHLTAHGTRCGAAGLESLLDARTCPRLTHIRLGANPQLDDDAMEMLAGHPGLRRIAQLDVRACPITEKGLRALATAHSMHEEGLELCVTLNELTPHMQQLLRTHPLIKLSASQC